MVPPRKYFLVQSRLSVCLESANICATLKYVKPSEICTPNLHLTQEMKQDKSERKMLLKYNCLYGVAVLPLSL